MQNVDQVFREDDKQYLIGKPEDYRLTPKSTFIDIGSGFGKPVVHAAMQIGCMSKGIEIVPARVEFCIDFIYEYEDKLRKKSKLNPDTLNQIKKGVSSNDDQSTAPSSKRSWRIKNEISWNPLDVEDNKVEESKDPSTASPSKSKAKAPTSPKKQESDKINEKSKNSGIEEIKEPQLKEKLQGTKRGRPKDFNHEDHSDNRLSNLNLPLQPNFSIMWFQKCLFAQCDAAKLHKLEMINNDQEIKDITHIYSYNKVMSKDCLKGIGQALNNTNFKILAWYVNEKATYKIVKNVRFLFKKPMQSTGKEKFSVYVFYKTNEDNKSEDTDSLNSEHFL